MKRGWLFVLPLMCTGLLLAQKAPTKPTPKPAFYTPDPGQWRLEVTPELGGWISDNSVTLAVKIVDPRDPNPPKDTTDLRGAYDDYSQEYSDEEEARPEKSADELRRERLAREEEEKRNQWRTRPLQLWFNGEATSAEVQVGYTWNHALRCQNGENRLEILQPDSGQRVVRTWWTFASRTRLRVSSVQDGNTWVSGRLEVMEPSGALATQGRRSASGGTLSWDGTYQHSSPPPGTYTLRWVGGYRGGNPALLRVEAVLDGGTDRERRWVFTQLVLPGAPAVTLGTFDIEP